MNMIRFAAPVAVAGVLALTACTTPSEGGAEADATSAAPAITPTKVVPDPECTITETGKGPGQTVDPAHASVRSLTITCAGRSRTVAGDFASRTDNFYDRAATGVQAAMIVDGEARIWHVIGAAKGTACLTIQRLDESSPSKHECNPDRLRDWSRPTPSGTPEVS